MARATASRRGRPKAGERAERERLVIAAALEELIEHGYERVTMLGIASRAGASKETLYNWFGSKEGLFAALIKEDADRSAEQLQQALAAEADPFDTLVRYATGLLTLLTSPTSVALNRAAMSSPELAENLLTHGRRRVGPVVERYLALLTDSGVLQVPDPARGFELLYGLVVRDTQIRSLLGDPAPSSAAIARQATAAVEAFFALTAVV